MKNVVFIANNNVGSGLSGGDRIFLEFLKNWSKKVNITVFASQETIILIDRYQIKNIKIIPTDSKLNDSNDLSLFQLLQHIVRRTALGKLCVLKHKDILKKADIIYSASDFYPDYFVALTAKILNPKIKWIAGYYLFAPPPFAKDSPYKGNLWLKGLFYWLMQRPTYFFAKRIPEIIFVTSKPDVAKFPHKKVLVIRGGVDVTESEKYLTKKHDTKKVYDAVYIGRFHPQKGIILLIDIWEKVTQILPHAKLAVIGNGELEKEVKAKIKKLKLNKSIDLLGFLDGSKKYDIFKQSKIVVHPATYDSGGMAAAEAMAWEIPGVSFDLEALKTYYPQGMIKTECFNEDQFAHNIIDLLQNKKLYSQTAVEARNLILTKWDWQKHSQEILKKILC
jgi:glycosyltransferase involved in cell wall biosynthesis